VDLLQKIDEKYKRVGVSKQTTTNQNFSKRLFIRDLNKKIRIDLLEPCK